MTADELAAQLQLARYYEQRFQSIAQEARAVAGMHPSLLQTITDDADQAAGHLGAEGRTIARLERRRRAAERVGRHVWENCPETGQLRFCCFCEACVRFFDQAQDELLEAGS